MDEVRSFEGSFGAVARAECAQKRGHIDFGRCLGDGQRPSDLFVRKTRARSESTSRWRFVNL